MENAHVEFFLAIISPLIIAAWTRPKLYRSVVTHWVFYISISVPVILLMWNIALLHIQTEITIDTSDKVMQIQEVISSMMIPAKWAYYASAIMAINVLLSWFAKQIEDSQQRDLDQSE